MARVDGKISKVKALLQAGPVSVKELIAETGITKATAYSLPYYLGKQGYQITKGENALKEATYHITGAQSKAVVAESTEESVISQEPVVEEKVVVKTTKPRKVVEKALAGKAAKKAK